jgi:hypothetical protein
MLHLRRTNLELLLARRPEGIIVNPLERGENGATGSGQQTLGSRSSWWTLPTLGQDQKPEQPAMKRAAEVERR